MKANPDFTIRTIGDLSLIVSLTQNPFDRKKTLTTNESGVLLWQTLQKDCTKKELADVLQFVYKIDERTALSDIESFLNTLQTIGALQMSD